MLPTDEPTPAPAPSSAAAPRIARVKVLSILIAVALLLAVGACASGNDSEKATGKTVPSPDRTGERTGATGTRPLFGPGDPCGQYGCSTTTDSPFGADEGTTTKQRPSRPPKDASRGGESAARPSVRPDKPKAPTTTAKKRAPKAKPASPTAPGHPCWLCPHK